jgi:DNA repair protein RecO (recombination protein O)
MRYQKFTGLIIASNQLKEASKLITIFTKEKGKVKVIAKGVNKTLSRKGYNLDSLNLIDFSVYLSNSEFNLITDTNLINDFGLLKKDFLKIKISYYIFELINKFLIEDVVIPNLFNEVIDYLVTLTKIDADDKKIYLLIYVQLKVLDYFGYLPQLNNCVICSDELNVKTERIVSSEEILGYVCSKHFDIISNKDNLIEDKVIKVQKYLQNTSLKDIFQLNLNKNLIMKIFSLQNDWIESILEKKIKSYNLLV